MKTNTKTWLKILSSLCALFLFAVPSTAQLPGLAKPELVVQSGHAGIIEEITFSGDGKLMSTLGEDETVNLWDWRSQKQLCTLNSLNPGVDITGMGFSPDGKFLAVADLGWIALFDIATRRVARTITLFPLPMKNGSVIWPKDARVSKSLILKLYSAPWSIRSFAFSPTAEIIATGNTNSDFSKNPIVLWNSTTGQKIRTLTGHMKGYAHSIAFSQDGNFLATANDKEIKVWRVATGELIRTLKRTLDLMGRPLSFAPNFAGSTLTFNSDGRLLAAGASFKAGREISPGIGVWNLTTGSLVRAYPTSTNINDAVFHPAQNSLVLKQDQTLSVRDIATGKEINKQWGGDGSGIAFHPHAGEFVTGGGRGLIWNFRALAPVRGLPGVKRISGDLSISPDGKTVIRTGDQVFGSRPSVWDIQSGKCEPVPSGEISCAAFAPGGNVIATGTSHVGYEIQLWDRSTGRLKRTLDMQEFGGVYCLAFSPNGKWLVTGEDQRSEDGNWRSGMSLWNLATGRRARTFSREQAIRRLAFSRDGRWLALVNSAGKTIEILDTKTWSTKHTITTSAISTGLLSGSVLIHSLSFASNSVLVVGHALGTEIWDVVKKQRLRLIYFDGLVQAWEKAKQVKMPREGVEAVEALGLRTKLDLAASGIGLRSVAVSADGLLLAESDGGNEIKIRNFHSTALLRRFSSGEVPIIKLCFSPDNKTLLGVGDDGQVKLWSVQGGKQIATFVGVGDSGYVTVMPDGYYMASRDALSAVAFRIGARAYPFEQFDLKLNRPDIVLDRLGYATPEVLNAHRRAYEKRLRRMGFTPEMLGDDFYSPEISLISTPPLSTDQKKLYFKVEATDDKYLLDRLNVFVNDVPVYGASGIDLKAAQTKNLEKDIALELESGANKVQVSVLDSQGVESLRETFEINCTAPALKPTLHVVCIGVSRYANTQYNLTYADKDARDLAQFFASQKKSFETVKTHSLLNEQATKANILAVKAELSKTGVDDQVILFFAGHGLLDAKQDYYFATHDVDFERPGNGGLSYEALEDLLDGIPARKKLLMMDTCHAGEVDKDDLSTLGATQTQEGEVTGKRGIKADKLPAGPAPDTGSALLPELFADLRRGSGAQVIAAAGGLEYSLESGKWNNGVFTFSVLDGLQTKRADGDKNDKVTVSELRDYVAGKVLDLTRGRQKPTARRENLESDFVVF